MIDTKTGERVLKLILEIKNDNALELPIPKLKPHLPDLSEDEIEAAISDFENRGLMKCLWADDTLQVIGINSSATGYLRKLAEDKEKEAKLNQPHIQQTFNVDKNYGAIGTNTNFTINNNFDFEELDRLIQKNTESNSNDRKELEELKNLLQTISQHNIPISKGYLSQFSEVMQKHSWITAQLTGFLFRWAFGQ